jgi:hypothetical protein
MRTYGVLVVVCAWFVVPAGVPVVPVVGCGGGTVPGPGCRSLPDPHAASVTTSAQPVSARRALIG